MKTTKRANCERCGVPAIFDRNNIRDVWVCRCCGTEKMARVPALIKRLREDVTMHPDCAALGCSMRAEGKSVCRKTCSIAQTARGAEAI